jgi:hypothetical protein
MESLVYFSLSKNKTLDMLISIGHVILYYIYRACYHESDIDQQMHKKSGTYTMYLRNPCIDLVEFLFSVLIVVHDFCLLGICEVYITYTVHFIINLLLT